MNPFFIAGFDPGSTSTGYGVLKISGTPAQPQHECCGVGEIASEGGAIDALFARIGTGLFLNAVAVELTKGIAFGPKGAGIVPDLIECARADAMICENVRARGGLTLVSLTARDWRKPVCGKSNPSDAEVKVHVTRYVRELPARTNVHNRDAIGVGLAAAWKLMARGWV